MKKKPTIPPSMTHLTRDDRVRIEMLLDKHNSIRTIAKELNRSPSTIKREIDRNAVNMKANQNDCALKSTCTKTNVCDNTDCSHKCNKCIVCKKYCPDYINVSCSQLKHSPHLCNGCCKIGRCGLNKTLYKASKAENKYRSNLVNTRKGFDLTHEEIIAIDESVSPLIKNGQSPYHIKQVLQERLAISESTLRRMIEDGELSARNIDLRDKVKRKPRQSTRRRMNNEIMLRAKTGRMYSDYLHYIEDNDVLTVQMDCVEGAKEDNATLLTLHFPCFHMQLAFIMEYHTSSCVVHTLDMIEEVLGTELFKQIFPLILTDNGHEFTDINGMERSIYGGMRTKIFFCEPNRSDEKGSCENNHKYLRYVIPKGTSLESFNQSDISLMMNHINSYCRKALFGKTPYEMAMQALPEDFFIFLGLELIAGEKVFLKPTLLSKKIPS